MTNGNINLYGKRDTRGALRVCYSRTLILIVHDVVWDHYMKMLGTRELKYIETNYPYA